MKREEIIKTIEEYFEENEEIFDDCIEELDDWDGYMGDDRYYSMDELDELFHDANPTELLNRAYFGYDSESYTVDQYGQKKYDSFNPNRNYFTFNGYGNLVSADYKDYSAHLDDYCIEHMAENREHLWTIEHNNELSELFDKLDEGEEQED